MSGYADRLAPICRAGAGLRTGAGDFSHWLIFVVTNALQKRSGGDDQHPPFQRRSIKIPRTRPRNFWPSGGKSPRIIGIFPGQLVFELDNEPHENVTTTALMNPIYAQAIAEIRKTNPRRTIVVEPGGWGGIGELKNLVLPPDDNVMVSVHCYEPFYFTHQGASWTGGPKRPLLALSSPGRPRNRWCTDPKFELKNYQLDWINKYNTLPAEQKSKQSHGLHGKITIHPGMVGPLRTARASRGIWRVHQGRRAVAREFLFRPSGVWRNRTMLAGVSGTGAPIFATGTKETTAPCRECMRPFLEKTSEPASSIQVKSTAYEFCSCSFIFARATRGPGRRRRGGGSLQYSRAGLENRGGTLRCNAVCARETNFRFYAHHERSHDSRGFHRFPPTSAGRQTGSSRAVEIWRGRDWRRQRCLCPHRTAGGTVESVLCRVVLWNAP